MPGSFEYGSVALEVLIGIRDSLDRIADATERLVGAGKNTNGEVVPIATEIPDADSSACLWYTEGTTLVSRHQMGEFEVECTVRTGSEYESVVLHREGDRFFFRRKMPDGSFERRFVGLGGWEREK